MILVIGEILFDQFPEYKRIGGGSAEFCLSSGKPECAGAIYKQDW